MVSAITAHELRRILTSDREIAVLDVRDVSRYVQGHLWRAINLPITSLELRIRRFVPRSDTKVVLVDEDDGLAPRVADILSDMGYTKVSLLKGGLQAWSDCGYDVIEGNYVIAHSFGYFLKANHDIHFVDANTLHEWVENGEEVNIIDTRTGRDYHRSSVPGSRSVPAAELVHRIDQMVANSTAKIVVHCAGITRGVLGAQLLLQTPLKNPVYLLENGTRGWLAAGKELAYGMPASKPPIPSRSRSWGRSIGAKIAGERSLVYQTRQELSDWTAANKHRTLYIVDIRSWEEYQEGHYQGAFSIPGGELAGMTSDHLATWNGRICLCADESGRAEITAAWLIQLGWSDVVILEDWVDSPDIVTGGESDFYPELKEMSLESLGPEELARRMAREKIAVLDFSTSGEFADGHIDGAFWLLRSKLLDPKTKLPGADRFVTTSANGQVALLAARELGAKVAAPVSALAGGTAAWAAADLPMEHGMTRMLCEIEDVDRLQSVPSPIDQSTMINHQTRYFKWRDGLYDRFLADGTWQFRRFETPGAPE